jgi:beta-barrel assembly-enhancing protease
MSAAKIATLSLGSAMLLAACQNVDVGQIARALPLPAPVQSAARFGSEALPAARGAFGDMDEPEEIELGRSVAANVGSRYPLLRDRDLTRYVALVGNVVAARSERPDLRYYFAVLDSPEVNAFAAPGGFVFITRGALALMRDEATLAGVLGHEIAHVALMHGSDAIKAEKRKQIAVLGLREGLQYAPVGAFSGLIASTADVFADQIVLKGFSRADEEAADRAGFRYATSAGYDAGGLRDFLAAMVQVGDKSATSTRFFSTHPGTPERLQEQERLVKTQPTGGQRNAARFQQAVGKRAG